MHLWVVGFSCVYKPVRLFVLHFVMRGVLILYWHHKEKHSSRVIEILKVKTAPLSGNL